MNCWIKIAEYIFFFQTFLQVSAFNNLRLTVFTHSTPPMLSCHDIQLFVKKN